MKEAALFYLREARAAKGWISMAVLADSFYVGLSAVLPLLFALIADWLTAGDKTFSEFLPLLFLTAGLSLCMRLSVWPTNYATERASILVQKNITRKIFLHLTNRSLGFHSNRFGGNLVADAGKVARNFETLLVFVTEYVFGTTLYLIIMFTILATQMPLFVPVLLLAAGLYIVFAWRVRRTEADPAEDTSRSDSLVSAHLSDTLSNIETVIASGSKEKEHRFYEKRIAEWETDAKKLMRKRARNVTLLYSAPLLIIIPLLFVGVFLVTDDYLSVGSLLLVLLYGQNIIATATQTNHFFTESFEALSQSASMVRILQEDVEIPDHSNKEVEISRGSIDFVDVQFAYPGSQKLFENFELSVAPKERIGLVGPSGAGKSTLFRLLLRMIEPESGHILIDGQDISKFQADSFRQQISYVSQEPLLFHRSIADNISYGTDATDREIQEAASAARADRFIENLPEGYSSRVGDRGVKLSGGERQRIVLARAFLRNAPILLLDEPTSSLDSYSENFIQQSIEELFCDKTALVIAHRLSTIAHLDRIVVLCDGHIAEEGSHEELLAFGGLYLELWQRQSEGFLPED